jgi:uncharacterized protein
MTLAATINNSFAASTLERAAQTLAATRRPGIYVLDDLETNPMNFAAMDRCAFVGIASRGPAYEVTNDRGLQERGQLLPGEELRARSIPVLIDRWESFEYLYGGLDGPGQLGRSVQQFFQHGGRQAFVIRVVPAVETPALRGSVARGLYTGSIGELLTPTATIDLVARNEGTWGNNLTIALSFNVESIAYEVPNDADALRSQRPFCDPGDTIRLTQPTGSQSLHTVVEIRRDQQHPNPVRTVLSPPPPPQVGSGSRLERVEGILTVEDHGGRREQHRNLRFVEGFDRYVVDELRSRSTLIEVPDGSGPLAITVHLPHLPAIGFLRTLEGLDRNLLVTERDVLGVEALPDADSLSVYDGLHVLSQIDNLGLIVVPDLYDPTPFVEPFPVDLSVGSANFEPCLTELTASTGRTLQAPSPLQLDPRNRGERNQIIARQLRVVAAGERNGAVALLDVPPGRLRRCIPTLATPRSNRCFHTSKCRRCGHHCTNRATLWVTSLPRPSPC